MAVVSFVSGHDVDYMIAAGKPELRVRSQKPINERRATTGVASLLFHWVQEGKTRSWHFEPSMLQAQEIQPTDQRSSDGSQTLVFSMGDIMPSSGLLRGSWEGTILTPAVHIDIPLAPDIWMFLLRSPWFPLRYKIAKQSLVVSHEQSSSNAILTPTLDGTLSTSLASSGDSIKKSSLMVTRKVGQYTSQEPLGEITSGSQSQAWRPILREFDLCLVTSSNMSMSQLSQVAKGLGAQFSSGFLGPGSLQGDFILCDGPLTEYSATLRCDLGLLRHQEDSTSMDLSW